MSESEERKTGNQFGPEPHQYDPYDGMSDEEFDREVVQPLREQATTISLRMPKPMLARTKEQADRLHVPYQRLMKAILASGLDRLERSPRRPPPAPSPRRQTRARR